MTWKNTIRKQEQIDIKDYVEMLEKLKLLAQKHNPNAMKHVDKLEEELLHLNTERQYGGRVAKAPFRRQSKSRRQMDKGKLKIKNRNISAVGQHVNKIIDEFENDPEYQRVGAFGIKLVQGNNTKGKEGLMFYTGSLGMDTDEFLELATIYLGKLGFTVEGQQGSKALHVKK